jgi:hypothetical protein
VKTGIVYTPRYWADWVVDTYGIADKWINGAVVLDPGCGRGALSEAVIRLAVGKGFKPSGKDLARLHGVDRDETALLAFRKNIDKHYGLKLPGDSLISGDYLLEAPKVAANVILANPPWISFGDLNNEDKSTYKPIFRKSGLTPDPRSLLLGGSRIDLAALFVATALDRDMAKNGEGYFFLPSNLFRGEGAHSAFRRLKLPGGRSFALRELRELDGGESFPGAGTRYCLAFYKADCPQFWPVPWFVALPEGKWRKMEAHPVDGPGSPMVPYPAGSPPPPPPRIDVPAGAVPRQGVNCGGASDAFILEEIGTEEHGRIPVVNKRGTRAYLPAEMVYPLMSPSCFIPGREIGEPERWIFLPYSRDGKILSTEILKDHPDAEIWLERHKTQLVGRKGALLGRYAAKGLYWALLGVGPYTFAPWKLAWESYGRDRFVPRLFGSEDGVYWQGNQALHAYIPFSDQKAAEDAFRDFKSPALEEYLRNLGGASTKSWAQPGRISRLLNPVT